MRFYVGNTLAFRVQDVFLLCDVVTRVCGCACDLLTNSKHCFLSFLFEAYACVINRKPSIR